MRARCFPVLGHGRHKIVLVFACRFVVLSVRQREIPVKNCTHVPAMVSNVRLLVQVSTRLPQKPGLSGPSRVETGLFSSWESSAGLAVRFEFAC